MEEKNNDGRSSGNDLMPSLNGGRIPLTDATENQSEREFHDGHATAEILAKIGDPQEGLPSNQEEGQHAKREAVTSMLRLRREACLGAISEAVKERDAIPRIDEANKKIPLKSKIAVACLVVVVCEVMLAANAARFAVDLTQSLLLAFVFVGAFPSIAFGLEAYAHRLATRRPILECFLGYVFVASAGTFLWSFAQEFAYIPGVGATDDLLGGFDYRVMLIAQSLLEITITFGLISKIRVWIEELAEPVINPLWRLLGQEIEQIDESLQVYEEQINMLEAESKAFIENKARVLARQRKIHRFLQS